MYIARSKQEFNTFTSNLPRTAQGLGFVPTMGALHAGHLALVTAAKKQCSTVVVSIFVNPTQFNDSKDFENYPITLDADLEKLEKAEVDCVFLPTVSEMYPQGTKERIPLDFKGFADVMEGANRPGHFEGVVTIVHKLFSIISPTDAFFGEKDYQQLQIIRLLAETYFSSIKIHAVSTEREKSGLAKSSRNLRLSKEEAEIATNIYKSLQHAKKKIKYQAVEQLVNEVKSTFYNNANIHLEYFDIRNEADFSEITTSIKEQKPRAFVAAFVNRVRLIDNMSLID